MEEGLLSNDERPKFLRVRNFQHLQITIEDSNEMLYISKHLFEDEEMLALPLAARWQVIALTILAHRIGNRLPNDPTWLAINIKSTEPVDVELLIQSRFLEPWL